MFGFGQVLMKKIEQLEDSSSVNFDRAQQVTQFVRMLEILTAPW